MGHSIVVVDAFTDRPFRGNPAAVTILDDERPDDWLQAVAAEMNLSETAFLRSIESDVWQLRWFTPTTEVELCGHATLASAHLLWEGGHTDAEMLRFRTLSGELRASRDNGWIWLDFPVLAPRQIPMPDGLLAALGPDVSARSVWTAVGGPGPTVDLLVELDSQEAVRMVAPDMNALMPIACRGVIVTAAGSDGVDFVSRFFAPSYGIPEDPVTGSAHCLLAPFWGERLGKDRLVAHQVSRRGGDLRLELPGEGRVRIGGQAITVLRSELLAGGERIS